MVKHIAENSTANQSHLNSTVAAAPDLSIFLSFFTLCLVVSQVSIGATAKGGTGLTKKLMQLLSKKSVNQKITSYCLKIASIVLLYTKQLRRE